MQIYQQKGLLIQEQSVGEVNPLYSIAHDIPSYACVKEYSQY
jgi:hypothetical protein